MRIFRKLQQTSRILNQIKTGDRIKETRFIKQEDVDKFADVSGDHNPIHTIQSQQPIVHGAFLNSIVSGIIGCKFPGPGTIVLSQQFSFPNKCYPDDAIEIVIELLESRKIMKVRYEITQSENIVFEGTANLLKPRE